MYFDNFPWIAVIVATVVSFGIGFGWFYYFKDEWCKASKIKKSDPTPVDYAMMAGSAFVTMTVLGYFVYTVGAMTLFDGGYTGFLAWFGFVGVPKYVCSRCKKEPLNQYLLESGQVLVNWVVTAALLAVMM